MHPAIQTYVIGIDLGQRTVQTLFVLSLNVKTNSGCFTALQEFSSIYS